MNLYYSTSGEGWLYSTGWLSGDPCVNRWHGVSCDEHGGVTILQLAYNNLTGVLNESIGDLFAFHMLILVGGQIGGVILSSFGKLKNATFLELGNNEFEGAIPASVENMTKLQQFSDTGISSSGASRSLHIAIK